MRVYTVPTGKIMVVDGKHGQLECLSIADYGKESNVKAEFLGLHKEIQGVPNGDALPLSEKWVITISSQYGCSMGCKFCDVPSVGRGQNAELEDMNRQIAMGIMVGACSETKRLNIHYARMGEPTFNFNVIDHAENLMEFVEIMGVKAETVHPVISTMMPKYNRKLSAFLERWCDDIKNDWFLGEAGLQLSINSTSDAQRDCMFSGCSLSLAEIALIAQDLPKPFGRKYTLNFAVSDGTIVDANKLADMFDTDNWIVKITPIHETRSSNENNIKTSEGYESYSPYEKIETDLIQAGFDVLVFVPSLDEDLGRITCGNAILSGLEPSNEKWKVVRF